MTERHFHDLNPPTHLDTNTESNAVESESASEPRYRNISISDRVEDIEWYKPGGYYPVDIDDIIQDRFKVVHKLGNGGIATVWLCWDMQKEKWRALKINVATHSFEGCPDLVANEMLRTSGLDALEFNHILLAEETLFLNSPNGRHLCAVLPVAGPSYSTWEERILEDFEGAEKVKYKKNICYQLTKALAFMHGNNVCHGDFRPDNILMKLKPEILDNIGYEEMRDIVGEPIKDQLLDGDERSPYAPKYAYAPINFLWGKRATLVSDSIVVTDFGEAYQVSNPRERNNIPIAYAGPEWLFGGRTGIGNDIWSWGYTLAEIQTDGQFPDSVWDIIRRMERFIGPVPSEYGPKAVEMLREDATFPSNGETNYREGDPVTGPLTGPITAQERHEAARSELQHPIHTMLDCGDLSRDEVLLFGDLLSEVFKYDPTERMRPAEALEHPWFKHSPDEPYEAPLALEAEWLKRHTPEIETHQGRSSPSSPSSESLQDLEDVQASQTSQSTQEIRSPLEPVPGTTLNRQQSAQETGKYPQIFIILCSIALLLSGFWLHVLVVYLQLGTGRTLWGEPGITASDQALLEGISHGNIRIVAVAYFED